MIPACLADMQTLMQSDDKIVKEFLQGNWVINKNSRLPFCAVGADHALEHINRAMKLAGGLVGIILNLNAQAKIFLISPELAILAEEAQEMADMSDIVQISHHRLSYSAVSRHDRSVSKLNRTLRGFTNPFSEDSDELMNMVTKIVMPEALKKDLCHKAQLVNSCLRTLSAIALKQTRSVCGHR